MFLLLTILFFLLLRACAESGVNDTSADSTGWRLHSRNQFEDIQEQLAWQQKKYFLSVMVMELNEVKGILEFMQHYIEEGADHVYIYDDGSNDGTLEALAECVPRKYYTIFTKDDMVPMDYFRQQIGEGKTQNEGFYEMYGRLGLRDSSEWVIVIDADELITSRNHPEMSIREVLMKKMDGCDVVSVPWLVFIWGNHEKTVANSARYRLFDRWGFDDKFAVGKGDGKFANINKSVFVKAIVRTASVPMIYKNHRADFKLNLNDTAERVGTVCISHADKYLKCVKKLSSNATEAEKDALMELISVPQNFAGGFQRDSSHKKVSLPPYCLHHNRLLATMSPAEVMLTEEDVDSLDLALFHYRVKSQQDWERMLDPTRFTGFLYEEYRTKMYEVNRMDVVDDFMVSKRLPARKSHPDFIKAKKIFDHCPAKYYL